MRGNIDRLDREIIRLMAERGRYVAEAGRFKANPAAVSAPARVEAIIAKVKQIAREDGLRRRRRGKRLSRDDRGLRGLRTRGMDEAKSGRRANGGALNDAVALVFSASALAGEHHEIVLADTVENGARFFVEQVAVDCVRAHQRDAALPGLALG